MSIPFSSLFWYNHYMIANTVIWGILGIVGVLLAVSKIAFKKRIDWRIGIGLALAGLALFALATELPQYGIGFSIVGTLIMAGAALMAIKQSEEKVRIDRRERKLIDIITWANDIAKCETAVPIPPLPALELEMAASKLSKDKIGVIFRYHAKNRKMNLVMRYQNLDAIRPRIALMAKQLDEELGTNLELLTQQTGKKLEEHVKLGGDFIDGKISDEEYKKRWESLVDSAAALAKKAEETI